MTNDNTHGGARPAIRPDDGRRTNRPPVHPGRKPRSMTLKLGDKFWVAPHAGEGTLRMELWTVTDVDRKCITVSSDSGVTYHIHR